MQNKQNIDLALLDNAIIEKKITKRKIGFFSSMLLVVGSSIGAGIFIKNHEILADVHGAVGYAIIAWIIAIIGIFGLVLALVEICSGSGKSNHQGIVGWVRQFCNKFLYIGSKNFMSFLHLPIYFFVLPMYLIMVLQQAFGFNLEWYWIILISFTISSYFIIASGLSSHIANIHNLITMFFKFFPILFAAITGFVMFTLHFNDTTNPYSNINWFNYFPDAGGANPNNFYENHTKLFSDQTAILGILAAIPAVFFAFDGFYATAGIQTSMREPKKLPLTMSIGIAVVSFIDIAISLSLLIGTNIANHSTGSMVDLLYLHPHLKWIVQIAQLCIAIGILGIINGFAIYAGRYYNDLVDNNELPFAKRLRKYLRPHSFKMGVIIAWCITLAFYLIFGSIGIFAFINTGHYGAENNMPYMSNNQYVCNLYSFCDLIANWNAVITFTCIIFAVIGCLINRKTHKIRVEKSKTFIVGSITTIIVVVLAIAYVFVKTMGDLYWVIVWFEQRQDQVGNTISLVDLIGSISQIITLLLFLSIMFVPTFLRIKADKDKGISHNSHRMKNRLAS